MSHTGQSVGGYTCIRCGSFVGWGALHSCHSPQPPTASALDPAPTLIRIADALERIAEAIERGDCYP